jgi:nucleotide-binding universal stress UspA family protein
MDLLELTKPRKFIVCTDGSKPAQKAFN